MEGSPMLFLTRFFTLLKSKSFFLLPSSSFGTLWHSLIFNSSYGLGDHGSDGIQTFLKNHKCVNRCELFDLSPHGFAKNEEHEISV